MRPFAVSFFALLISAYGQGVNAPEALGHGLPDLKQQQIEQLLKEDRKKSVEDAAEILDLSTKMKEELESSDPHVLSMKVIKQAEEIEKLAKRIRGRMRRF